MAAGHLVLFCDYISLCFDGCMSLIDSRAHSQVSLFSRLALRKKIDHFIVDILDEALTLLDF